MTIPHIMGLEPGSGAIPDWTRPDLSTGNSSAAHFALARRKLSRTGPALFPKMIVVDT